MNDTRPRCAIGCGRLARLEGDVRGVGWGVERAAIVVELVCWRHGWRHILGRLVARVRRVLRR